MYHTRASGCPGGGPGISSGTRKSFGSRGKPSTRAAASIGRWSTAAARSWPSSSSVTAELTERTRGRAEATWTELSAVDDVDVRASEKTGERTVLFGAEISADEEMKGGDRGKRAKRVSGSSASSESASAISPHSRNSNALDNAHT